MRNRLSYTWITEDSTLDLSKIILSSREDVNKDGVINIEDIALVASAYNYQNTDNNWNADYDINNDSIIDIYDIVLVSKLHV